MFLAAVFGMLLPVPFDTGLQQAVSANAMMSKDVKLIRDESLEGIFKHAYGVWMFYKPCQTYKIMRVMVWDKNADIDWTQVRVDFFTYPEPLYIDFVCETQKQTFYSTTTQDRTMLRDWEDEWYS